MMRYRGVPLYGSLLMLCSGCIAHNDSSLVGTYRAQTACSGITLVVNADHTFHQSVAVGRQEVNTLSGKWDWDSERGFVTFSPFLDLIDDPRGKRTGSFSGPVERLVSVMELGPVVAKCPGITQEVDYVKVRP